MPVRCEVPAGEAGPAVPAQRSAWRRCAGSRSRRVASGAPAGAEAGPWAGAGMLGPTEASCWKPPLKPSCEAGKEWAMPILTAVFTPDCREVDDAAAQ